jgi:hypothetical protein
LNDALDARPAVLVEQLPFVGQGSAPCGAQEQAGIELGFQLLHTAADGGAANAQAFGSLGETAFVDHRDERHDPGICGGKA